MYDIKTRNKTKNMFKTRRVVAYDPSGKRITYDSISHACRALGMAIGNLTRYLQGKGAKGHTHQNGWTFYYGEDDPNRKPASPEWTIPAEEDLPVISFDRDTHKAMAEFKSVSFLSRCICRKVKVVYDWLHGAKQVDIDFRYKYKHECTPRELAGLPVYTEEEKRNILK